MCAFNMDTANFVAAELCCACGGGVQGCSDLDEGATDAHGRRCSDYDYRMCAGDNDDEDFTAASMCCACAGGSSAQSSGSSESTSPADAVSSSSTSDMPKFIPRYVQPLADDDDELTIAGAPSWATWLIFSISTCLALLCLAWFCRMWNRKPMAKGEKFDDAPKVMPKEDMGCFIINDRAPSASLSHSDAPPPSPGQKFAGVGMPPLGCRAPVTRAATLRDDASEATSVYASACDLFTDRFLWRPSAPSAPAPANAAPSFFGGCTSGSSSGSSGLRDGAWIMHGRPDFRAEIRGNAVGITSAAGQRDLELKTLPDGRFGLEGGGALIRGQLIGDRLLWENGETWRRAGDIGAARVGNSSANGLSGTAIAGTAVSRDFGASARGASGGNMSVGPNSAGHGGVASPTGASGSFDGGSRTVRGDGPAVGRGSAGAGNVDRGAGVGGMFGGGQARDVGDMFGIGGGGAGGLPRVAPPAGGIDSGCVMLQDGGSPSHMQWQSPGSPRAFTVASGR